MPTTHGCSSGPLRLFRPLTAAFLLLLLAACAGPGLRKDIVRPEPTFARPPASHGILAGMAAEIYAEHGKHRSGVKLLDRSDEALGWRLALIDSAVSSLDIQTYLWHPDNVGRLILQRAIDAAGHGVHVRLIVDDGHAAILGGRNIGDHYFGLNPDYNFHDLDTVGFGHIAIQANGMFDHFWNSEWVVSGAALDTETDPAFVEKTWNSIRAKNAAAPELKAFGVEARDRSTELAADLIEVMERDMRPESAWRVHLDDQGKLYWVNSRETLTRQPARKASQRVSEVVFGLFPKEQF